MEVGLGHLTPGMKEKLRDGSPKAHTAAINRDLNTPESLMYPKGLKIEF